MAKKIFRENQKYKRWEIIGLLVFMIGGLAYRFIDAQFISGTENAPAVWNYIVPLLLLAAVLILILSIRLSIRITDKHISYQYFPLERKRHKIKWDNVADCNFVETPESAQWSGWNVNFSDEKMYSICGRTGLRLKTKDGEEVFIGSRRLGKLKKAVKKVFKK